MSGVAWTLRGWRGGLHRLSDSVVEHCATVFIVSLLNRLSTDAFFLKNQSTLRSY